MVSGAGTNLQALIEACNDPAYGAHVVAVGADRDDIEGLRRAERVGIPTFVCKVSQFETREDWDRAMARVVSRFKPDFVVLAGFMKLFGQRFLGTFPNRILNTHPALSPAFPGMRGPAEAIDYGVKVSGCTLFVVDPGVDTGPIIAQRSVAVADDDDASSLHERIKIAEREMLVETVGRIARESITITNRKVRFGR